MVWGKNFTIGNSYFLNKLCLNLKLKQLQETHNFIYKLLNPCILIILS